MFDANMENDRRGSEELAESMEVESWLWRIERTDVESELEGYALAGNYNKGTCHSISRQATSIIPQITSTILSQCVHNRTFGPSTIEPVSRY